MNELNNIVKRIERFGKNNITISICYGPCGNNGLLWSVNLLNSDFEEFNKPYAANSLKQCLDIAELEAKERNWID